MYFRQKIKNIQSAIENVKAPSMILKDWPWCRVRLFFIFHLPECFCRKIHTLNNMVSKFIRLSSSHLRKLYIPPCGRVRPINAASFCHHLHYIKLCRQSWKPINKTTLIQFYTCCRGSWHTTEMRLGIEYYNHTADTTVKEVGIIGK